jgi:hypothetical protein
MSSKTIHAKILAAKQSMGVISKNAENPHFRKKYADLAGILDVVEPALAEQGLLLLQPVEGGHVHTIIVDTETGDTVVSAMAIPDSITDPQKLGSCITYFRRYTLTSLLGLKVEDDDGNGASKPTPPPAAPASPASKPAITPSSKAWAPAVQAVASGKYTKEQVLAKYAITGANDSLFDNAVEVAKKAAQ